MFNLSHLSVFNDEIKFSREDHTKAKFQHQSDEQHFWTVWEHKLHSQIYYGERIALLCIFCFVTIVAVVGNLLTLYVVISRKHQRLLFKTCLLSLALSDLIFAIACGLNYISKLVTSSSALWYLGKYGCILIPFFQTSTMLSGSFSLVIIAFDRYVAVFNKRKGQWHPNEIFCAIGLFIIWAISCGISSPMLFSYQIEKVFVVPEQEENLYEAYFCLIKNEKDDPLYYYCIIFTFIFLPLFVTFIFFNSIIARQIWKRRKVPGSNARKQKKINEDSSTTEVGGKSTNDTNSTTFRNGNSNSSRDTISTITQHEQQQQQQHQQSITHNDSRCNERQRRQMRMFKVILVLMCVFIMFRLPNWIFLLYKLNFRISARLGWLMNYSFSILGILNSMVNPFLYTFLSETIRFTSRIRSSCYKFCKLCRPKSSQQNTEQTMFGTASAKNVRINDNGGVYLGN